MALYDGPEPTPSAGKAPSDPQATANKIYDDIKASGGGGTSKNPTVFMGWGPSVGVGATQPTGPYAPGYKPSTVGNQFLKAPVGSFATAPMITGTLDEITAQYYSWDQKTKDKFLAQASLAGYDTSTMKDGQLAALWGNYVAQAADYFKTGQKVTPWDIMAKDRAQRESAAPRTVTQKSTSYDLSTEGDARAIFYTAAQQLLGRDPTKSETKSFQAALNKMERANPTVTTTTANYLGQELQSQESTTEGGVKEGARQMEAMDLAKAKPEYGAYQAATTYFDAMMQMLGGQS